MISYSFRATTRVVVTPEPAEAIRELVRGRRVGVISTKTVLRLGACVSLLRSISESAESLTVLGTAQPNPTVEDADVCLQKAQHDSIDLVVAIGGGSAIDQSKAVRAALSVGQDVRTLFETGTVGSALDSVKLVAIPSVFGTGAETSAGAILTRSVDGKKGGIRGAGLSPDTALISTFLAVSLSAEKLAEVGFDALTHSIETFLSRASSPVTDAFARDVMLRLPRQLVKLFTEGISEDRLQEVARCSFLMGYNLANASTCLPHRMQYAVASFKTAGHQRDLAALYPAWIRALDHRGTSRLDEALAGVTDCLQAECGIQTRGLSHSRRFAMFLERINMTERLDSLGLTPSDIPVLTARTSGNIALDPLNPTVDTITHLFADALSGIEE